MNISSKDFMFLVNKVNDIIKKLRNMNKSVTDNRMEIFKNKDLIEYFIDKHAASEQLIKFQQTRWEIVDKKLMSVNGGTNIINEWTDRELNNLTLKSNFDQEIEYIKLNDNTISFREGLYIIKVKSVFTNTGGTRIRLYDNTTSTVLATSISQHILASNNNILSVPIELEHRLFFVGDDKNITLQYYTTNMIENMGLGMASGISGEDEIYTSITIEKLA